MLFISERAFLISRASCACGFLARAICLARASLLLPLAVSPRQGVTQGDPLAMIVYGIIILPLIKNLKRGGI